MEAYVGEIRFFPYDRIPDYWLECNGQLVSVSKYNSLASLLGLASGDSFRVPDMRGRTPVGFGAMASGSRMMPEGKTLPHGSAGGAEMVTLTLAELPQHTHEVIAETANSKSGKTPNSMKNTIPANVVKPNSAAASAPAAPAIYGPIAANALQPLAEDSVQPSGGGAAHDNRQPFLPLVCCICALGIYPSRG